MTSPKFKAAALALGMASLSVPAFAQVSIYGVIDLGLEALSNVPVGTTGTGKVQYREQSANAQLSRLGFKGTEELSPCLKAIFKLDAPFFPDTGSLTPSGKLFHGASYVGLSGCQGELTVGRQISLMYEEAYFFDPLSIFAYALPAIDVIGFGGRADNSIKYRRSVGNVTFAGLYSFGYTGAFEETAGSPKIAREVSASLNYDDRRLAGAIAFDRLNGTTPATQSQLTERLFIAGSIKLAENKIYAGYERFHQSALNAIPVSRFTMAFLGLQHAWTSRLDSAVGVFHKKYGTGEGSALLLAANLDYFLSKRTDLYLNVGRMKNRGTLSLGVDGQAGVIGPGTLPGQAQNGIVTGIRHTF